jgi:4-diphosphocytidyl-2-C-methyl-D-erythritol kinase
VIRSLRTVRPAAKAPVTARACAKVNLDLRVGAVRPDGYHELSSVFLGVGLHDDVTVRPSAQWSLTVEGKHTEGVPTDETNLAWRAAVAVAELGGVDQPVAIHIDKNIPVAGGMAGGSADAAASVLACNALWEVGLDRSEMLTICADLGSDVPFCLSGGVAVGRGRGEQLVPVLSRGTFHFVFAASETGLSTPTVYAEYDRLHEAAGSQPDDPGPNPELLAALRAGDAYALASALHNDLEAAALSLQPQLGEVIEAGIEFGALAGIVSGSGPTVAFLAADQESALHLAIALTASGTSRQVRHTVGPAQGAHLVAPAGRR